MRDTKFTMERVHHEIAVTDDVEQADRHRRIESAKSLFSLMDSGGFDLDAREIDRLNEVPLTEPPLAAD